MKLIERRIEALETRHQPPDPDAAERRETVEFLATWAVPFEVDRLFAIGARQERGKPLPDDAATIEALLCRWNTRLEDPAVTPEQVSKADRIDWRDPARYIGDRWINWLLAFPGRDPVGETTPEDRATWWKLADVLEHYIIRGAPLPAGLDRLERGELEELWLAVPAERRMALVKLDGF